MKKYQTILTIAGSDPIGGAGIQADIKTATSLGVYAMSVITAVTAQNTTGVKTYEAVSSQLLKDQLSMVLDDVTPDAVKIGMIPTVEAVEIIADLIWRYNLKNIVADPVCVATSGDSLTDCTVPEALAEYLFPKTDLITPNIPETEVFLGCQVSAGNMKKAAEELSFTTGAKAVLVKGGHNINHEKSEDILFYKNSFYTFQTPRIATVNTHGTGCSLSSAIASYVAKGLSLPESVGKAKEWISEAIRNGADYKFGRGHGPINHLFNINQEWK